MERKMNMKIKLEDVIDTIEMASAGVENYYNSETGEIVIIVC